VHAAAEPILQLADWRRRVAELYADVRRAASPEAAWRYWRSEREALFRTHPQSPIPAAARAAFFGIPCFEYDPRLRCVVETAAIENATSSNLLIGEGELRLRPALETRGLASQLGRELTVYWIEAYAGGLLLPFRDATSGTESYGGGRYLLDTIKGADLGGDGEGRLILDFNFAYHPSCAYDPAWVCPLAPRENWLEVPVRAGERFA
jgi:uncharacterized protein (DUF1684 family)